MTETQRTAVAEAASKAENAVVLAEKDPAQKPRESYEQIYGPVEDELFGKRIRKSFGLRAFWGTVVDAYVVGRGLFYKVSFDDGDVDILSVDEVKVDLKAALLHAAEDAVAKEPEGEDSAQIDGSASAEKTDSYAELMRSKKASLKRRRDSSMSESSADPSASSSGPWQVKLWSMRLFATIMEEKGYIRVQSFVPMANGDQGELESTGTIQPGDALLAVHGRVVHGVMDHIQACDLIRALPRPITLTFIRPPSTGEILTEATAANLLKAVTPPQLPDQNGAATKKLRTNEEAKTAATTKPPTSSPDTHTNGPRKSSSRPPTPEVEIVQVVQPSVSSIARPQPRHHQASPYFARGMPRGPSPPVAVSHPSSAGSVAMQQASYRHERNSHQIEPIPYRRQPSPLQRDPSPNPPGAMQMAHPQGDQLAFTVPTSFAQARTQQTPDYRFGQYQQLQQPAGNYTSTAMAAKTLQAPPMSTRPVFYVSQPAPTTQYAQGAPAQNRTYRGMSSNGSQHSANNGYPGNNGRQNAQPMNRQQPMASASGRQQAMVSQGGMHSGLPQTQPTTSYREAPNYSGSAGGYQQAGPAYTASTPLRDAYLASQAPPQQQQQPSQRTVAPQSSALATQLLSERASQKPANAKQTQPVTLNDLVERINQRQRDRVANAQRVHGNMAPPNALTQQTPAIQSATSSTMSNGGGSAARIPDKQQPSSPTKKASPAQFAEEAESYSFLSGGELDDDDFASTGTSFLSLDDMNTSDDIPATRKPSALAQSRGAVRPPPRPSYLNKYANDEVVNVSITQMRLYLTLAAMGDHIAVSSFVRGQFGEIGEIEASGKVLVGDILVGIGPFEIEPAMAPSDVARLVSKQPRPYVAHFMRPSWDMLE